MQVTKELVTKEIAGLEAQLKQLEASAFKLAGAIQAFKDIEAFMNIEPPKTDQISAENLIIQERDQARALSMNEVAELVAGPGAVADEPVSLKQENTKNANR